MSDSNEHIAISPEGHLKVGDAQAKVNNLVFTVLAGKYEGLNEDPNDPYTGLNIKYISEDFTDLAEAQKDLANVSDYPWAIIEVKGNIYP